MNRLYELISDLRKERGIKNDAELARLLGERQGLLSDLKNNDSQELKFEKLRKIAYFFGVPIDYFDETGEPDPRDIPPEPEISDSQLMFALWKDVFPEMNEKDLEDVFEYAHMKYLKKMEGKRKDGVE